MLTDSTSGYASCLEAAEAIKDHISRDTEPRETLEYFDKMALSLITVDQEYDILTQLVQSIPDVYKAAASRNKTWIYAATKVMMMTSSYLDDMKQDIGIDTALGFSALSKSIFLEQLLWSNVAAGIKNYLLGTIDKLQVSHVYYEIGDRIKSAPATPVPMTIVIRRNAALVARIYINVDVFMLDWSITKLLGYTLESKYYSSDSGIEMEMEMTPPVIETPAIGRRKRWEMIFEDFEESGNDKVFRQKFNSCLASSNCTVRSGVSFATGYGYRSVSVSVLESDAAKTQATLTSTLKAEFEKQFSTPFRVTLKPLRCDPAFNLTFLTDLKKEREPLDSTKKRRCCECTDKKRAKARLSVKLSVK